LCEHLGQEIEPFLSGQAETAVWSREDVGLGSVPCDCGFFFLDLIPQELTMLLKHHELRAHVIRLALKRCRMEWVKSTRVRRIFILPTYGRLIEMTGFYWRAGQGEEYVYILLPGIVSNLICEEDA
jgi:hypothetical protein